MPKASKATLRQDGALWLSTLGVLTIAVLYLVPPSYGVHVISWYEGSLLTQPFVLFALQYRLRELRSPAERRFWNLWSWGFFFWLTSALFVVFFPVANKTMSGQLFEDVCYLLFYFFFFFALENRPFQVVPADFAEIWYRRRRYDIVGGVLLAVGLLLYFVVTPLLADMSGYNTYFPSGCLYVTLDLMIVGQGIYSYRIAPSRRWRQIYGLIIITSVGMLLGDIFDTLTFVPDDWFLYNINTAPPEVYTLWYLYLVPLIWAARLRHVLSEDEPAASSPERWTEGALTTAPFFNILLFYAILLPVLHLVFQFLGVLGAVQWRALVALCYLFFFVFLIFLQQQSESEYSRRLEHERADLLRQQRESIAALESKNRELESFTYTVSHDLKSPLVTIRGFLGLLKKDIQDNDVERTEGDIRRIQDAAEQMGRLLDDLLELSRVGRFSNTPTEVSLGFLARTAAELVAGAIRERGVEVEIRDDLPTIRGDQRRLQQVFQNLLENAVKFMGEQENPKVAIYWRDRDKACCVEDNGVGVAQEHQEKVFELFKRLDSKTGGTGFGLALVQRIVELHGGRIWIESEGRGHGTRVCFTLPKPDGC